MRVVTSSSTPCSLEVMYGSSGTTDGQGKEKDNVYTMYTLIDAAISHVPTVAFPKHNMIVNYFFILIYYRL